MTLVLAALVDGAAALALGLAAVAAARQRSAATRHAILAAAIASALVMPLLKLFVPELPLVHWFNPGAVDSSGITLMSGDLVPAASKDGTVAAAAQTVHWAAVLAGLWIAGAICMAAVLATSLIRLRRFRQRCAVADGRWGALADDLSRACGIRRPVTLLESGDASVLISCGVLRPAIVLPPGTSGWTETRMRTVLAHELAHIRRHDAAVLLAGEALRVFQWFNPLVWITCRRLRRESEFACDDEVLSHGVEPTAYATHLLDVAKHLRGRRPSWTAAHAIAHPSTLERRIAAMLQHQRNRARVERRGWLVTCLAALGVSLPLAAAGIAPADVTPRAVPASRDVALAVQPAPARTDPGPRPMPAPRPQATGSIAGTLLDQLGGTLPGATVTLTNADTNEQSVTRTDAIGRFEFRSLQPATYSAIASLPGFKSGRIDVALRPGLTIQPTLTLALGTVHETIHVGCGGTSGIARVLELTSRVGDAVFPRLYAEGGQPVRVGGSVHAPLKLRDVRPACPAAVPAGETTIHLAGHIGVNGLIEDAAPVPAASEQQPPAELTQSALDAIRQWTFTPTVLDGQAVPTEAAIDITFASQN